MKAFAVWLLGVVLVPFAALAQAPAVNLNTITAVQVNGGTVTITGTQKPNFTTFTMTDPPRLVIDISEAVFSEVPEEIQVGNGTVTGIRTASYGSDASSIARVLIGYAREVEADIQAQGNQLIVRVAGGGGQAVAQAPATEQPPAGNTAEQAAEAAAADREAQERAAADAAAAARAEREAQEKAAAEAAAAAQRDAEAEAKRQEEARAAAQRQQEEAQARAQAQAEAERKRQEEEAARASAEAAEEKRRQEEAARASKQAAEDERRAQAQAAAEEQQRKREAARAEAEQRQASERAAAEERRARQQAAAEERRAQAQAAAEERRAQAQAAAEERRQRQADARAARENRQQQASASGEVSSRRKTLTLVGFRQQPGASRVFVQTNEPVSYSVGEQGRTVVLELENTRVDSSNNTLPLDTSFFASPVLRVDPSTSGRDVRVTIELRQSAPFQARQEGNVISLDFQRTGR
ncbi:AMIN domain-containing protein [Myxococcus sp. Y35]|uniref:AMIN domain-containing protein n=1 Tax=Pseudomyxococcus flavus TaxID=3115648 RepID=UPI003CF3F9BD